MLGATYGGAGEWPAAGQPQGVERGSGTGTRRPTGRRTSTRHEPYQWPVHRGGPGGSPSLRSSPPGPARRSWPEASVRLGLWLAERSGSSGASLGSGASGNRDVVLEPATSPTAHTRASKIGCSCCVSETRNDSAAWRRAGRTTMSSGSNVGDAEEVADDARGPVEARVHAGRRARSLRCNRRSGPRSPSRAERGRVAAVPPLDLVSPFKVAHVTIAVREVDRFRRCRARGAWGPVPSTRRCRR